MDVLQVVRERDKARHTAALMVFYPVHPTAVPNGNDVFHADVFGAAREALRATADKATPLGVIGEDNEATAPIAPLEPGAIVSFVNGAEGDVSPAWPLDSCPGCSGSGFHMANVVGDALAGSALHALAAEPTFEPVQLRRVHADVPLTGGPKVSQDIQTGLTPYTDPCSTHKKPDAVLDASAARTEPGDERLCRVGALGTSAAGGAEDGPTGYRYSVVDFQEGDKASNKTCQDPKRMITAASASAVMPGLPFVSSALSKLGSSPCSFPEVVPLSLLQIGSRRVLMLPAEATTTAGLRLVAAAADSRGTPAIIAGLTSGYASYLSTPEEYQEQQYEGGSTVYGAQSVPFFEHKLAELAGVLNTMPTPRTPGAPVAAGSALKGWPTDGEVQTAWTNAPFLLRLDKRIRRVNGEWLGAPSTFLALKNRTDDRVFAAGGGRRPIHAGVPDVGAACMPLEDVLPNRAQDLWYNAEEWSVSVTEKDGKAPVKDRHDVPVTDKSLDVELRVVPSLNCQAPVLVSWFPDRCPRPGETRCLATTIGYRNGGMSPLEPHCERFTGPGWSEL